MEVIGQGGGFKKSIKFALLASLLAMVPMMQAEATPPRAPTMTGYTVHDEALRVTGYLSLGTLVPANELSSWVTSYKVQWKSGSQEYDLSRQAVVTVIPPSSGATSYITIGHRINGLSNGVEYTIRAIATNSDGDGPASNEITATPNTSVAQLRTFVEEDIVEEHEASFPWLRQTWKYMNDNNVRLGVTSSGSSRVLMTCDGSGDLKSCRAESMWISTAVLESDDTSKKRTLVHELAHVYTDTNGISTTPAPLGAAFLYFRNLNLGGSNCGEYELFADILTSLVLGGSTAGLEYWTSCGGGSHTSTAQAVARSAVGGQMPSWFASTYDDSNSDPDLAQVWTDLLGLQGSNTRKSVAYRFRNSFGGYCSEKAVSSALTSGSRAPTNVTNPWEDGGCLPSAPVSLNAVSGGDGTISLSWEPPASDGGLLQFRYQVRWKPGNRFAEQWQREIVTLDRRTLRPSRVSHTITGTTIGAEYAVRVLAYGLSGAGPAAEVTVTPPVADGTAPELLLATVGGIDLGSHIVLTYSEALDETSEPAAGSFTVSAGGNERSVSRVRVRGNTVVLQLFRRATPSDAVSISYTVPTDAAAPRIQDVAGNDAGAISNRAATNTVAQETDTTPVSDTVAPKFSLGTVDGARLTLTYNEVLDENSEPAPDTFAVRVGSVARSVEDVSVDNSAVTLTLSSAVARSDAVTVSYAVPTDADDPRIQDVEGNDAGAMTDEAITNITPREPSATPGSDTVAPRLLLATVRGYRNFARIVLTYDEGLDRLMGRPVNEGWNLLRGPSAESAFTVSVRNVARRVTQMSVSGSTVRLDVAAFVTPSDSVTLSYTVPTDVNEPRIEDEAGNEAPAITDRTVTNITPQVTAPTPVSDGEAPGLLLATVEGDRLVLNYSEALDRTSEPGTGAFAVRVGGVARSVEEVWVRDHAIRLTLASAVASDDTVTISYMVPTDANAPRIRDAAGDAAEALSAEAVTNVTPTVPVASPVFDAVAPLLSSAAVERARLVLTYNEALDEASEPAASAFAVNVASVARSVAGVSVEGNAVVLTLASAVTSSDAVTVSYTVPTEASAPRIQDAAGNEAAAIAGETVTNTTPEISSDATLISVDYAHRIVSSGDRDCTRQGPGGLLPDSSGSMRVSVGSAVETITLFARTSNAHATVAYGPAEDADATTCGHQVVLGEGETVVTITVTAEDGVTTRIYSITITRSDNNAAGVVAISGTIRVGETLTATVFGLVDVDGLDNATLSYQWISNDGTSDADIVGAATSTYTLVAGDVGKTIKVRVTFTDDEGNAESLVSEATAEIPVVLSVADANAHEGTDETIDFGVTLNPAVEDGTVTVDWATADGTAIAGEDYTAGNGTLTFAPGETSKTVSIGVVDDDVEDSGETFTLRLNNAVGATIADGEATGTIFNSESPFNSLPQVAGVAQVGNTLSVSFMEAPSGTVTYQWLRDSEEIAGATAGNYTPVAADVGAEISVRVESGGDSITSASTGPVWPAPAIPPLAADEEELLSATITLGSSSAFPVHVAGYVRDPRASFGSIDDSDLEVDGTQRTLRMFMLNGLGRLSLSMKPRLENAEGLRAYWNGHRIAGFKANMSDGISLWQASTTQPKGEYSRYWEGASDGVLVAVSLRRTRAAAQDALTAEFQDISVEAHDGSTPFTFEVRFSADVYELSYTTLRDSAFTVTNGSVTKARRIIDENDEFEGNNQRWEITVEPQGNGAISIMLPATTNCTAAGAICTVDDRPLSAAVTTVVPREEATQQVPSTPLTVRFEDIGDEHDGTTPIVFKVKFNKRPKADYSYVTMRDSTLRIGQGDQSLSATKARRLNKPHNDEWEITIDPVSKADLRVGIAAPASCSGAGAVCTEDDELLSNSISKTILGPPGLSVADARVYEAEDATLDFAVTLGRASASAVTVDYATSDGTATAGADYTATSGTLAFAPGETAKTVSVLVLGDDHDEGGETLTLTLSNPQGGNAYLKDGTATGTIENTDAMPRAWLARFGRTVAEQVMEAVEGRFQAARAPGVQAMLAGQPLPSWGGRGSEFVENADMRRTALADTDASAGLETMTQWLAGAEEEVDRPGRGSRAVTPRDLLTGSSFALTGGTAEHGLVSLWGRGAVSRFDGREGDLTLSGEVASAMLGADWARERWTAGLLLSRSEGEGSYGGEGAGEVSSTLTGLFPYGRYLVNDRLTLWGVAGYGEGELVLTPDDGSPMRTDMDLAMGAAGMRGVAVEAGPEGGGELAVTSDATAVRTASERTRGLVAAEADVTRLRLGLEGTWRGLEAGGGPLVPRLEVGLRHDGGDAETGFGLELGGGLSWSDPASGLSAEFSGRGLLTHEADGFRDRGLAGSFAWDPGQGSGRGPSLTLTQTAGASASGGMDALLRRETLAGLAANDNGAGNDDLANRRLELRMGYGFPAFGDWFTSTPELSLGLSNGQREYGLGWRLNLVQSGANALELKLEATRRETLNDNGDPEHGVRFGITARW